LINTKNLVLAANYQTYKVLNEKGIDSLLWEDCYDKDDLLRLYRDFKIFCNEWYTDERGKDCSRYDGMSFGSALSIYFAYDLETWIRVFYLFEYLASKKIDTKFYVLNKDYFPHEVWKFIDNVNKLYGSSITIISLDLTDSGIEASVNRLVKEQRCSGKLEKNPKVRSIRFLDYIKNIFSNTRREKIRCFITHIRNTDEYLGSFLANGQKTANLRLFFDAHYLSSRRMFAYDLLLNKISFIYDDPYKIKIDESYLETYTNQLLKCAESSLNGAKFLGSQSQLFFRNIFFTYLSNTMREQIHRYYYLDRIIKKNKINVTLCDGPDLAETHYCKHIMDKYGGVSFYIPHGLMCRKDKELDRYRESIAHNYFYFNKTEKDIKSETYNIHPERFYPIRYLEKNNNELKTCNDVSNIKILILLGAFQGGLNSYINYFKYFLGIYETLKDLSLNDITVRPHPQFYIYYPFFDVTDGDKERFFYSLPIQNPNTIPLKEAINNYDVVISWGLSSSILEAMWAKVFFIPYIPDYFPSRTLDEIIKMQWLPELYPKPCQSIEQLKNILSEYIQSPESEYNKYLKSIKEVGNSELPCSSLLDTIVGAL